jgi:hypothetical protein
MKDAEKAVKYYKWSADEGVEGAREGCTRCSKPLESEQTILFSSFHSLIRVISH